MNINLCTDHEGRAFTLAETRFKRGFLTLTRTVARKKTTDFQFFGSLSESDVVHLRDELGKWLKLLRSIWRIKHMITGLYLQEDGKSWGAEASAGSWLYVQAREVISGHEDEAQSLGECITKTEGA